MDVRNTTQLAGLLLVGLCLFPSIVEAGPSDLDDLSLEELLEVEVVTASKRPTTAFETPSAITVLTREDLRRNGAVTLVDALEWVPGIQFSRLNAANTAVGVRGFNGVLSDKLLVLIDGRSIYSLFFSGVYWDEHDLPLEDIERIEIIRGPGGALWGANAVNGVINVVTKHSDETLGWRVASQVGAEEFGIDGRYGGRLGRETSGRFWVKGSERSEFDRAPGHYESGGWQNLGLGGRLDAKNVAGGDLLLTGQAYTVDTRREDLAMDHATSTQIVVEPEAHETQAAAILARWERPLDASDRITVQTWAEIHDRDERILAESRVSYDLDVQYTHEGSRHVFVAGANYRATHDDVSGDGTYLFVPARRDLDWWGVFAQDEVRLGRRLRLVAGAKLERNDFSGWELQPSLRTALDAAPFGFLWGSVSRAVRTPSRAYTSTEAFRALDGEIVPGLPMVAHFQGDPGLDSESMVAFEAGWRRHIAGNVTLDVTAFRQAYDDLIYTRILDPMIRTEGPEAPHVDIPALIANGAEMTTRGIESMLDVRATTWLRVQASYTYLRIDLDSFPFDPEAGDFSYAFFNNNVEDTPQHAGFVRLRLDPHRQWEFDLGLRGTSALEDVPTSQALRRPAVDAVTELSARIGWRPYPGVDVSLLGRNLVDDGRVDLYDRTEIYPSARIPTQVFLRMTISR